MENIKYKPNKWFQNVNFITVHNYTTLKECSQLSWSTIDQVKKVKNNCCNGVFKIKYKQL